MSTVAKKWVLAVSSLVLLSLSQLTQADTREVVNENRAVASNEKIYIEVMSGEVTIKAGSGNQFIVTGKLDEKATGYVLDIKDGFTRFEMTMPRQVNYNWMQKANAAELTFEVPAGSSVEFKGVNSNVNISGISGGSRIHTVNGQIRAQGLSTQVQLTTVNGQIVSAGNSGRVDLNSVNGEINDTGSSGRIDYSVVNGQVNAASSAEEVSLSTVNGKATVELTGTQRLKLSTVNGRVAAEVAQSVSPRISGSSVSGDILLKLDSNTNARVDIKTSAGGDIDNTLTDDKPAKAKYGPARSLQFTLGNGDGSIDLTTVSGDIELKKL
jgi:DUF4097 and DUF4098 domain-containing protein YvlB/uncharacterized membrane protein